VARPEFQNLGAASTAFHLEPFGDAGLLVTIKSADSEMDWRLSHMIADKLEETLLDGVLGTIATYDTVLIEFDPVQTSHAEVTKKIEALSFVEEDPEPMLRKRVIVPVVYGGEHGPDLESTAQTMSISPAALVESHCEPKVIRCVVSPAGSPMTDGLSLPGVPPRLAVPRSSVPAGSVAIAGEQSMIYATSSPGGWRLIGRTPVSMIDAHRSPPVRFGPGDLLCPVPISADRWSELEGSEVEVTDA